MDTRTRPASTDWMHAARVAPEIAADEDWGSASVVARAFLAMLPVFERWLDTDCRCEKHTKQRDILRPLKEAKGE